MEWHNVLKWRKGKTTKNTLSNKALIQKQWRNQKLYGQAKAKRIQHHQINYTTTAKGIALSGKEKDTTSKNNNNNKLWKGELTGKGKHTVKVENYPQTNMTSKSAIMRRLQDIGNEYPSNAGYWKWTSNQDTCNLKKNPVYI